MPKYATPPEKAPKIPKSSSGTYGSASSDRPHVCPYGWCGKAYMHSYKLKLHLKREHPGHDENAENVPRNADNEVDQTSDQDAYTAKRVNGKAHKQSRPKPNLKQPPAKIIQRKGSSPSPSFVTVAKMSWQKEENYEEDSEETEEEDRENAEDGWRYGENNDDDDEETEYED